MQNGISTTVHTKAAIQQTRNKRKAMPVLVGEFSMTIVGRSAARARCPPREKLGRSVYEPTHNDESVRATRSRDV